MTVAFLLVPMVVKSISQQSSGKAKKPCCLKRTNAASKQVSNFADGKSWIEIDIMEKMLEKLNYIMMLENRNVLLFLDNATAHPENLVGKYSSIKIVFLPKNTTSRLQPLDAGIIKNFKVKYRYYVM